MSNETKSQGFPTQQVLELACAAQRVNNEYVKESQVVYADDGKIMGYKYTNKQLMQFMVDPNLGSKLEFKPPLLCTNMEDAEKANQIKKHFKKLIFNVVAGEDQFSTQVFALQNAETIPLNQFGFIACLPSVYEREFNSKTLLKKLNECDNATLGIADEKILDRDSEILRVRRSKNYDAWNILAIIDNKICSWMSQKELQVGPAVIIKANVKGFAENWHSKKPETRLNYVKVAQ